MRSIWFRSIAHSVRIEWGKYFIREVAVFIEVLKNITKLVYLGTKWLVYRVQYKLNSPIAQLDCVHPYRPFLLLLSFNWIEVNFFLLWIVNMLKITQIKTHLTYFIFRYKKAKTKILSVSLCHEPDVKKK